jgi:hypothetical protein
MVKVLSAYQNPLLFAEKPVTSMPLTIPLLDTLMQPTSPLLQFSWNAGAIIAPPPDISQLAALPAVPKFKVVAARAASVTSAKNKSAAVVAIVKILMRDGKLP